MAVYKSKNGTTIPVCLQDGSIVNFISGNYRTVKERTVKMLDSHPHNGRTFIRVDEAAAPETGLLDKGTALTVVADLEGKTLPPAAPLQEVAEVTTVQQAAEWLATNHDVKGIRSKVGAQQAAESLGFSFPNL